MEFTCKFCNKKLSSKSSLNNHQKTAKYCLKIQGKELKGNFKCNYCNSCFTRKHLLEYHIKSCKISEYQVKISEEKDIIIEKQKENIKKLEKELEICKKELKIIKEYNYNYREDYKNLSLSAIKRPTHHTSNKTIQINNYIKNMQPLEYKHIEQSVPMLTLDHHVKGPEGYAEYALEFPFKDRIVCVDVARNKIKYKNKDGDVIEDVGFRKMMMKLCDALKDRSFKLCQDHYEKLARKFSEEEMDNSDFDFMEAAKAIHKFANGRESDFCTKIIKLISKGAKKN